MVYWLSLVSNLIKTIEREKERDAQQEGLKSGAQTSATLETNGIILSSATKKENEDEDEAQTQSSNTLNQFLGRLHSSLIEIFKLLLAAFYVQVEKQFMSEVFHFDEENPTSMSSSRSEGDKHVILMSEAYEYMKQCQVMPIIIMQFFNHVFFYLNAKTFNNLLRDEQLVTEKTGISLKISLCMLEEWAINTDKSLLLPLVKKQMGHVKEAAILLVMPKMMLVEESSFTSLFSSLNLAQIRHLLSSFSQTSDNGRKTRSRVSLSPSDVEVVDMLRYKLDQMCSKHTFQLTLPTISLFDACSA
jgi:hypothetical protein